MRMLVGEEMQRDDSALTSTGSDETKNSLLES
jgi:hypothetical protein